MTVNPKRRRRLDGLTATSSERHHCPCCSNRTVQKSEGAEAQLFAFLHSLSTGEPAPKAMEPGDGYEGAHCVCCIRAIHEGRDFKAELLAFLGTRRDPERGPLHTPGAEGP